VARDHQLFVVRDHPGRRAAPGRGDAGATGRVRIRVQFSGLLQPVSTLKGGAGFIGSIWPASYYMHSSLGAYTKGLGLRLMTIDLLVLACSIPVLLAISWLGLRKQEK
jgi:hypothetical protein